MTNSGLANNAPAINYKVISAVNDPGTLLTGATGSKTMDLCGASAEPLGFAYTSSKNPVSGVAEANTQRAVHALIEGQLVKFPLKATNAQIAINDLIAANGGSGMVDKKSGAGWIVGRAEEAAQASAGGFLMVRVSKRYDSA
jgi:hypothetical protein